MITTEQARKIIAAGEAQAKEIGVPVNLAVLDAGTHLKAFIRMDGAVLGSIDVAIGKAALFQVRSDVVWDYCKPGAPAPGVDHSNGGLMPFAGGIPLVDADGTVIGAVGVSGGAVPQDLAIAEAAIAALNFS
jgi:uncharacterized protein GlcG (DUF336 family)